MNRIILTFVVIIAKITNFIEEHPFCSILIFILILRYFFPIPYLPDFVGWIIEFIKSLELISFGKEGD